ncbi:MAG: TonB-dependent receptor [Bacteroidetes bacterium HGW-Bacteroidetes-13]|nr:MAG: TonB-dependent receptor [Bacteroidetes bacterium HGW-Bacteroidetes-13]
MELKQPKKLAKAVFLLLTFFAINLLTAQNQRTVSGTVHDENSVPLPGATILVSGTTIGTTSDFDGNFTLQVPIDAKQLEISYIGYLKATVAITNNKIVINLKQDASKLEEVVVVGYGTQKKSDVTGSVSKVEMEKALAIPTSNVAEMLRGQAAGVQITLGSARPGGTSNILIRGRNSIRGGNSPLIVLDGFPIEDINDVAPDDIASIEVLKDASAQAIYGARASNGVILITTKRGKEGKMTVSFNSYTTTQELTKNFELFKGEDFVNLRREARRSINPIVNGVQEFSPDDVNFTGVEFDNFTAGKFTDWEDLVLKSGTIYSQTVSVSGGDENTKVFSSVNYFRQLGLIPTADYVRGTFRLNIEQKINKKLKFGANINISTDKQRKESSNLDFITISPLASPRDEDGNLISRVAGANASSSTQNPLFNIQESDNATKINFYNLNVVGDYQITKNLSYKVNTLFTRRLTDVGTFLSSLHPAGITPNGSATVSNTLREEYLIENILNYNGQITDNHRFDVTFVQSINQRNTSRTTSTGTGFGSDILGFDGISNALNFKTTRDEEQFRISSFLGRLRYTMLDRYLVTLTVRKDGASVFSDSNKWGVFPAASVAWQAHKESFLRNVKSINELKARLSWGEVGNQSLDPFTTLGVVGNFPFIFGGAIVGGNLPGTVLPNPDLTWETSTTFNTGLDFGLFNNRISGSADYYHTNTTDLLTDITLGGTSGFSSTITNGGKTINKGVEVVLTGQIIRNKNFDWSITTTFTNNSNEIVKTGLVDINGKPVDDRSRNRFVGKPINVIRTLVFDGIFQTDEEALASAQGTLGGTVTPFQNVSTLTAGSIRLKDVNGDGVINDDDNIVIGTDPKWYGAVSTNLRYKNFELLADLYIVEDATKFNPFLASFNEGGTLQSVRNSIKVDFWTPENPSKTHPRPNFNSAPANISTMGVADASFVRLRTLTLGYNLPKSLLESMKLSSFKFYVTGSNLFTITSFKSFSPENLPNEFPDTRSYTFGLNVSL